MTEIIGQILGILALIVTIICYQLNSQKKMLAAQIIAATLFTVNLALLGGMSGALLNIHGICRCLTFYQRGRYKWADNTTFWVWFYSIAAVICVALTYKSPLDIFPLVGQIFTTISFAQKDAAKVRLFTLPSPPCWFIYHLSTGNIGGTLNEIFVICSIFVGMFRLDRKKNKEEKST